MSLSICASCLSRLRLSPRVLLAAPTLALTSSFHSSSTHHASPLKKKVNTSLAKMGAPKHRESKSAQMKKKRKERPKPPAVGERRAARKRIVLSNTNALEIEGMADLSVSNMADPQNIGQMLGLQGELLDQLRDAKVFKTTQDWNLFRRPATLVRAETVDLASGVRDVNASLGAGPKVLRQVVDGERLVGKSILLLQAMAMGYMNKWVVVNVPEAQDFILNHSSYTPLPQSRNSKQEQLYIQPHLTSDLLSRMAYSNDAVLSGLKPDHPTPKSLPKSRNLKDLALLGANDPNLAWPVWEQLWKELTQPANTPNITSRPPLLIAIDGLDHWMRPSKYCSTDHQPIHAHQFALIRHFLSLLFSTPNAPSLPSGIVLGATTSSNSPSTPSLALLLRQISARAAGASTTSPLFPLPEPYSAMDARVLDLFNSATSTTVTTLKGLSKTEAKALLEYFAKSGILKETITEALVGTTWSLGGGGNVGEMVKLGKRLTFEDGVGGTSRGMWPGQGLHKGRGGRR